MKYRICVVGAGPAGLTVAYKLAQAGHHVVVFEQGNQVGGMCRSFDLWGNTVDIGPHRFFSNHPAVNSLWLEIAGRDYDMVSRLTRIFYKNRFFSYPLNVANVLFNLGIIEILRCSFWFMKERIAPTYAESDTFESWVTSKFGKRLYGIFFRTYSEKLWGISCDRLSADFATQRIKKLDFKEAVLSAFSFLKSNKHRTLVDEFAYPHQGTGKIYQRMAKRIIELGSEIVLDQAIEKVLVENNQAKGVRTVDGKDHYFNIVISTMPLTTMVKRLANVPNNVQGACSRLKFRNTILVYLEIDSLETFPDNWIYIHSPNLHCGRVTNFNNWSPTLLRKGNTSTIVCMEYWANTDDELWKKSDFELEQLAKQEIVATGLIGGKPIANAKVVRVPRSYPVYELGYEKHVDIIRHYLQTIANLHVIGRYGSFKYNNQDHSILMGIELAKSINTGSEIDVWNINSDDEYQESSTITATGLSG